MKPQNSGSLNCLASCGGVRRSLADSEGVARIHSLDPGICRPASSTYLIESRNVQIPGRLPKVATGASAPEPSQWEIIMSDYDPNRLDPNRPELNREAPPTAPRDPNFDRGSTMNWSWVLAAAAVIVLLLVGMSLMSNNDRTAEGVAPSRETTGQQSPAPSAVPPAPASVPAEKMSPRPASPNQ
jgi:hypothetical protein